MRESHYISVPPLKFVPVLGGDWHIVAPKASVRLKCRLYEGKATAPTVVFSTAKGEEIAVTEGMNLRDISTRLPNRVIKKTHLVSKLSADPIKILLNVCEEAI